MIGALADTLDVRAAGVDTWSLAWKVTGQKLDAELLSLATRQGPAGSRLIPEALPSGHRIGWFPKDSLMWAEGHPEQGGLASGDGLQDRFAGLKSELVDLGLAMNDTKLDGVRRMDSTVDLCFGDNSAGVFALAAFASMQFPRCKTDTIRAVGDSRVETVYIRGFGGKRVLGRMYDKGVEALAAGVRPGGWVRLEDQRRFKSGARPLVSSESGSTVKERFESRFRPLYKATKGVTVGGPLVLNAQLSEQVRRGDLSYNEAERIAGYVSLAAHGLEPEKRRTKYRRRAEARAAGVYDSSDELIEVDLASVLEAALDSDCWENFG